MSDSKPGLWKRFFSFLFCKPILSTELPPEKSPDIQKEWIDYGKTLVRDNGLENVNQSGEKLKSIIGWLWTLYTGLIALDIRFSPNIYKDYGLYIVFLPSIVLIIAYFYAHLIAMHVNLKMDLDSADDIEYNYKKALETKKCRYKKALLLTVLGTFVITFVYPYAMIRSKIKPEIRKLEAKYTQKKI